MSCGLCKLALSWEIGKAMVLKSDKLEPRSTGSTSMGPRPSKVSEVLVEGGRDWSKTIG